MSRSSESQTRVTLLGRLQHSPDDPTAWAEFVQHYGTKILVWCHVWGLQKADAQDVTQAVLLKLTAKLREFEYDPSRSFRGWLKTLAHHAWKDHVEQQQRPGKGSGDSDVIDLLNMVEARQSLVQHLEEAYDQELLKEAMARIQLRVEPRTWQAFWLLAIDECSGADVAERLDMKVATVFVARSKVQRMLREEIARLDGG